MAHIGSKNRDKFQRAFFKKGPLTTLMVRICHILGIETSLFFVQGSFVQEIRYTLYYGNKEERQNLYDQILRLDPLQIDMAIRETLEHLQILIDTGELTECTLTPLRDIDQQKIQHKIKLEELGL